MISKLEKIYDERVIKWFYILLPIIEVITTYMVINVKSSITVGMIYKTLFLIYGIFYLIFVDKVNKKWNFILIGIFLVSVLANVFVSIDNFGLKALLSKAVSISKYVCFPISMIFLYKYHLNGNKVGLKTLAYSAMIYATVMIIARTTGTHLPTYDSNPDWGHTGWFYSGNEISSLMAIFYPITIYFASKYKNKLMIYSLTAVTYGLLTIGTKTSFMAIMLTLVAIIIFEIIMWFTKKSELGKSMLYTSSLLLVIALASSPYSPSMKFIADRMQAAKIAATSETGVVDNTEVYKSFVFNGRDEYITNQSKYYKDSSLQEKIFGLKDSKRIIDEEGNVGIVERDFHDILFTYGIFGLIVYFIPMILIIIEFLRKVFDNIKVESNEKNCIMVISIILALGISYVAGHVLLAPTVALYLSVIFSKLVYGMDNNLLEG